MPYKNSDAARILREHHQVQRTFAKLRGTPGSPRKIFLIDRLDGIDDEYLRLEFLRLLQYFFEAGFAKQEHIGTRHIQTFATELHLHRTLFATYVKRLDAGGCHGGESGQH